jgi:hypothetical protein
MNKNVHSPLVFILFPLMFMVSSCNLFDSGDDECDKTKMPFISKTFIISVQIMYKDNVPFDGKTEFYIVKERCDGSQSGSAKNSGTPDESGIYFPGLAPTYNFYNEKDKVYFKFTAYHTPYYPPEETTEVVEDVYYYKDAELKSDENDEIIVTYYITIPTNSDGTI